MTVLILLAIAVAASLVSFTITRAVRRHATPRELRGDWWTAFERDFRAYAARPGPTRRRIDRR
jgi:uncharacterized lipoprotein YddW (UPF0748 family)